MSFRGWRKIRFLRRLSFWKLVGRRKFESLDKESRDLLIDCAGCIDFGFPIDIEKTFKYDPYGD